MWNCGLTPENCAGFKKMRRSTTNNSETNISTNHYVVIFRHIDTKLEPTTVPVAIVRCDVQPETVQFVGIIKLCLASLW